MVKKSVQGLHKCIALEHASTDVYYTFNFNPSVQPYYTGGGMFKSDAFVEWYSQIIHLLNKLKHCVFQLNLEISPTGRFHFHGFIRMKDIVEFYVEDLAYLKDHAFEIDTIKEATVWCKYVYKQKELVSVWCAQRGIEYPIYSKSFNSTEKLLSKLRKYINGISEKGQQDSDEKDVHQKTEDREEESNEGDGGGYESELSIKGSGEEG